MALRERGEAEKEPVPVALRERGEAEEEPLLEGG